MLKKAISYIKNPQRAISVDVILCCYNQEQYIAHAIESILSQNSKDLAINIIIADDCSTDNTLQIIKEFENTSPSPFIYLSDHHNLGLHRNYRRAFAACSAEYIAILEGDDWWHSPNHLQQHVHILESNRNCSMSFNTIRFYYEIEDKYHIPKWKLPRDFWEISLKDQILGNRLGNLSACVFRNKFIKSLPTEFYNLNYADWELGIWMAQFGPIGFLKESTSTYRVNGKGQWTKLDNESKNKSIHSTYSAMDSLLERKYHKYFQEGERQFKEGKELLLYISWKSRIKRLLKKL